MKKTSDSENPLTDHLGYHLRVAQDAAAESLKRNSESFRVGRLAILTMIRSNPGLNQTQLSTLTKREKSTITPALVQLEREGLIERERKDQRTYGVYLTQAGAEMTDKLVSEALIHDQKVVSVIGADSKAQLIQLLLRLTEAYKKI